MNILHKGLDYYPITTKEVMYRRRFFRRHPKKQYRKYAIELSKVACKHFPILPSVKDK